MGLYERITKNANKTINSENTIRTKQKLIKNGLTGGIVFFILAVALLFTGIVVLTNSNATTVGVILIVLASLCFVAFSIFLIILLVGLGMAAGGIGAKILDTSYNCPYCQTELTTKQTNCPSCGKPRE